MEKEKTVNLESAMALMGGSTSMLPQPAYIGKSPRTKITGFTDISGIRRKRKRKKGKK